jgi:hypothetical protein
MSRWIACALVLGLVGRAAADRARDIVVEIPGERSTTNKLALGGIAGGGVLLGALGLYFHLDARTAADEASADRFNGKAWTADRQELADRADRSSTRAIVLYSVGSAALIGAIVTFIVTEPKSERSVIRTQPVVTPAPGGATIGGMWRF